mgnify:CR=1 FL=1
MKDIASEVNKLLKSYLEGNKKNAYYKLKKISTFLSDFNGINIKRGSMPLNIHTAKNLNSISEGAMNFGVIT